MFLLFFGGLVDWWIKILKVYAYCVYVRTVRKGFKKTNPLIHQSTISVLTMNLYFRA